MPIHIHIITGRIIYGFGGESLAVANSAILSEWFKGKELAFAFGLNLSVARLGSVLNNFISPRLASSVSITFASWFGCILCGAGVVNCFIVSSIDKAFDSVGGDSDVNTPLIDEDDDNESNRNPINKSDGANDDTYDEDALAALDALDNDNNNNDEEKAEFRDILEFSQAFWLLAISCVVVYGCVLPFNNIASSLLLERDYFVLPENNCLLTNPMLCQTDTNVPLPTCNNYYNSNTNQPPLPSNSTKSDIDCNDNDSDNYCYSVYCNRLTDAEQSATETMSIPYFISAGLSPFLGAAVDRYGQRAVIAAIAPALLIIVHLSLAITNVNPVIPLIGQGLAYSGFAAVLWPSVPLVIEQRCVGLGFGIVTSVQNAGLAAFPLIVAAVYQASDNTFIPNVEYFFVGLASLGFIIGIYLNYYDYYHNKVFNSPGTVGADVDASQTGRTLSTDPSNNSLLFAGDFHAGDRARKDRNSRSSIDGKKQLFKNITAA
jgi:MFS family permease